MAKNSKYHEVLLFLVTCVTAAALLLFSAKSDAYEWVFTPRMQTDIGYTDNVNLADGKTVKKKGSVFTRLVPGAHSKFTSRRFDSDIDFSLRNIIYANFSERNRSFVNLSAKNTGEIVENFLYVDGNVLMRQQNQFLVGQQGDDVNLTGNFQDIRLYTLSPYVRRRFGNYASTELRYARVYADSNASTSFFSSQVNTYQATLVSGDDFKTLEWGLNYSRQDIEFDLRPDSVKIETGIANIQYNLTRRFGLTGTGGYENNNFGGAGTTQPKGARWSAGFVWVPNKRTSLEASVGQRFFGDTYYFDLSHRRRMTAINAIYREEIRSAFNIIGDAGQADTLSLLTDLLTGQAPPGTDPATIAAQARLLLNELGLPSFLGPQGFLTNRYFLDKRFNASLGFNTPKNTAILNVFHTKRTPLDNTNPLLVNNIFGRLDQTDSKQLGVGLTMSHRLAPRTLASLSLVYTHVFFPTLLRKDDFYRARFVLSRQISEILLGYLAYSYLERRSNDSLLAGGDFNENRFTASLVASF